MTAFRLLVMVTVTAASLAARGDSRIEKELSDGKDLQTLFDAEKDWAGAEVKHDEAVLTRILDDRFVATLATGWPLDKAEFIAAAMKFTYASQSVAHDAVHFYGDTAVIVGTRTVQPLRPDQPPQSFRYTTVYQKSHGHWLAIAEQVGAARPAPR